MNGSITAQGSDTEKDYFVIYAKEDINFTGSKLDVKGDSGIRAYTGNITINGNLSVSVKTDVGVNAPSGSVSIDGDTVSILCAGEEVSGWADAIGAKNDVTLKSNDATLASYYGIYSEEGDISLTGNIAVGGVGHAIIAESGSITVDGDLSARNVDDSYYCIVAVDGDISLKNGTVDVTSQSIAVITHNGSIFLNGNIIVTSLGTGSVAINAREGDIVIQGGSLDVTTGGTHALGASNGQINIAQSLKIFAPLNCRIDTNNVIDNASVIVDANGNPVSHVEIGHGIGEVSVYINSPVAGDKPASSASDVYLLPEHSSVKSIEWFVSDVPHSSNDKRQKLTARMQAPEQVTVEKSSSLLIPSTIVLPLSRTSS